MIDKLKIKEDGNGLTSYPEEIIDKINEIIDVINTHWFIKIGSRAITTKRLENFLGYIEKGTEVTIVGISNKGYNIQDDSGNRIVECGWTCVKPY